jgi:hypothetical protein
MKLKVAIALTLVASAALAAGPSATLTWTAPTVNTDGSPVSGTLTYNVYSGATATTLTKLQSGVTGLTVSIPGVAGSTSCFSVTAVEGGQESAQSNVACKTFPASVPDAPTNLVVQ